MCAVSPALHSLLGFAALFALAWVLSEHRRAVPWRTVGAGMLLTLAFGVLLLKVPLFAEAFVWVNRGVTALERATQEGTSFVFGYLGGGPVPFEAREGVSSFVLATRALPIVLVVSALSALLFYWGILPFVVRAFSLLLRKTMGLGGAVGLAAAANVFAGMVEAPLVVRPYVTRMSRSELFNLMTCGMATIAGTVMVLYATIIGRVVPSALAHILVASLVATPAAIAIAALMVPPTKGEAAVELDAVEPSAASGAMDAITKGTLEGVELLVNIIAMLIVLVALVALANAALSLLPRVGGTTVTLQRILGVAMAPVVWVIGIPWREAAVAGELMGTKTVLNELVAYLQLAALPEDALSPRSRLMMTYALCGFANFGSLGIMIGGLATLAPERRAEIVSLGTRTIVSGTLATLVAGSVVGMLT
jgi:CNT family concentrative nucleoside transporter